VWTLQYTGLYCPLSFTPVMSLWTFEIIQYALCHRKFSYMINQKFMKLCTLQDPNMKMCILVGYPGPLSFTPVMLLWTLTVVWLPGARNASSGKWKRHPTCLIGQVKMILWYVQFLKSKIINIELFSVGSRGEFYLNIASYVSCFLHHFVDYGIPQILLHD
jgi:hypothetical protein